MASIEINGIRFDDVDASIAQAVQAQQQAAQARVQAAEEQVTDLQKRADALQGEKDVLEQQVTDLKAENEQLKTRADEMDVDALVQERTQLLVIAERFDIDEPKALGNKQLKVAVLSKYMRKDVSDASDDYLAACFDRLALDFEEKANDAAPSPHLQTLANLTVPTTAAAAKKTAKNDGADGESEGVQGIVDAQARYDEQLKNAWVGATDPN